MLSLHLIYILSSPLTKYTKRYRLWQVPTLVFTKERILNSLFLKYLNRSRSAWNWQNILSIVSKIVLYDSVHVIESSDRRHKYSEYRRSVC